MKIIFIQTGGTIDKDYPKTKGYAFEINEPAVQRILERLNPNFEYEIISLMKKDSTDITDKDRNIILKTCSKLKTDKIIITHGTDTILKTAKELNKIKNKIIILTGAFKPERFSDTDAPINLGTALGAISNLKKGIYLAINGRVYAWNKCARDKNGKFVDI